MTPEAAENLSYDLVPYQSNAHPYTQPDRLAAIATLYGMDPPPVQRSRVLEIGCASGGNLIPLAERYPQSEFLGIDLSGRQIADGQDVVNRLGLKNVRLVAGDLTDLIAEEVEYDFIIAHGVYSWTPPEVAGRLLELCSRRLSANGLAMVSYNVYPGWHLKGMVREFLQYRCRDVGEAKEQVRVGREGLDFWASFVSGRSPGFAQWVRSESAHLRDCDASHLLHDQMETHNHPCYFHEFAGRAAAAGLKYVADAEFVATRLDWMPPEAAARWRAIAPDAVQVEQYSDFLHNVAFRKSILCRATAVAATQASLQRIPQMFIACPARPTSKVEFDSFNPSVFTGKGLNLTAASPLSKALLVALCETWPRAIAWELLLHRVRTLLGSQPCPPEQLAQELLNGFSALQAELWTAPSSFTTELSQRPVVSPYARLQAAKGRTVTNRRHESIVLDEFHRHLARRLDGSMDRSGLLEEFSAAFQSGSLKLPGIESPEQIARQIDAGVAGLRFQAFLIA